MRIIPAIDIIDGKCVRLTQGDYSQQKTYRENPVDQAKEFEGHGMDYLHLVDLDGAKSQRIVNYNTLEAIASQTSLRIDFGGGVKSDKDVEIAFDCGAVQLTGGSIAVKNPDLFSAWLRRYGSEKIILGADVKEGGIAIHGWKETSPIQLPAFLQTYVRKGVMYAICTDVSKDGMLEGPALELYRQILADFPSIKLIASGGVSSMDDVYRLQEIGCEGAIIGKAIYENKITLKELEQFITDN